MSEKFNAGDDIQNMNEREFDKKKINMKSE